MCVSLLCCQYSIGLFYMLGVFAYYDKARVSLVLSVRLSVRRYKRGSYRTDFHEISYWGLPLKIFGKHQICFKSAENIGHFK
jgi:hypothetical protein